MKHLLTTSAIIAATAFATAATAHDHRIRVDGNIYASTVPSENSAPGHRVWTCTPKHVSEEKCVAVDQEYYDQQALVQYGPWSLTLMKGVEDNTGTEKSILVLRGGISTGIGEKLQAAIEANPDVDTIALASNGGNPAEAIKIYNVIKSANLKTWVPEGKSCMSACAEIFLAGSDRIITGVVGFHSAWYNWSLEMPTDLNELVDHIALIAQKHQARFSAQHQAAGLSGEFNIDIAEAEGEFLVFASSEELDSYTDPACFDCVDHTAFLRSAEDAMSEEVGDSYKINGQITIESQMILASAGI